MSAAAATPLAAALARLEQRVDWERRDRRDMRVSLAPVADLLDRLGRPQQALRVVHVAGSKGKGSVCALVAAGLRAAGLRAGCLLSPHVETLNERVLIDGRPIDDAGLASALTRSLDAQAAAAAAGSAGAEATRFDLLIAASFAALHAAGVAWGVVEVGLGGRDDSTNVVAPEVAVLTPIGLEHEEVLGPGIASIAAHKAGIVKPGCTLVTAIDTADPAWPPIADALARTAATLHRAGAAGTTVAARNLELARAVLDALGRRGVRHRSDGRPLSAADLGDAVAAAARLPGRHEHRSWLDRASARRLPLVIDGAHTDFALRALLDDLAREPGLAAPPVVLLAIARDKPAARLLRELAGRVRAVVALPLTGARAGWEPAQLVELARSQGLTAEAAADVDAALARGTELALQAEGGWLLATGSLHLAGPVRAACHRSAT